MKRVMGLVLAVLLFVGPVFAEEIDFSSMSLEELQAISIRLSVEIETRFSFDSALFGSGVHIGGKTIKIGTYTFACTETFGTGYMRVWNNEKDFAENTSYEQINIDQGQILTLGFSDGTVIVMRGVSGTLSPVTAPWAP